MSDTDKQELQPQIAAGPLAPATPAKLPITVGYRGLEVKTFDDLWRVSSAIARSGLAPKGIETPEAVFVAIEMGLELGLSPMSAIQNIAVINGRPGVFGDVPLALVRSSGLLEEYFEEEVGHVNDDTWGFRCTAKRQGCKPASSTFTVADAKRAGLWGTNTWSKYPRRMLKFRARSYLLRDEFGDVLKGIQTTEELEEIPEDERRFRRARRVNETPAESSLGPAPTETAPAPAEPPPRKGPTLVEEPLTDEQAEAAMGLAPEINSPSRNSERAPEKTEPSGGSLGTHNADARGETPGFADAGGQSKGGPTPTSTGTTEGAGNLSPAPVSPKPKAKAPEKELGVRQKALLEVLTENGFTFSDLVKAGPDMIGSGNKQSGIVAWDTYSDMGEFPDKAAIFFLRAKDGMLGQLKMAKARKA